MTDEKTPTENLKSESDGDVSRSYADPEAAKVELEFFESLGAVRTSSTYTISDTDNPHDFVSCEVDLIADPNQVALKWRRHGIIGQINSSATDLPILCTMFEGIIEKEFPPTVSFHTDSGVRMDLRLQPGMVEDFKRVLDGMDLWNPSALWFHDADNNRVTLTPVIKETPNA